MNDSRVRTSFLKSNQHLTYTLATWNSIENTITKWNEQEFGLNQKHTVQIVVTRYIDILVCVCYVYISTRKQKMKRSVERNMGWVLPSKDSMDLALHAGFLSRFILLSRSQFIEALRTCHLPCYRAHFCGQNQE